MRMYLQIRTNVTDVRLNSITLKLTDGRTVHPTWVRSKASNQDGTHVCILCEGVILECDKKPVTIPELKCAKLCGLTTTISDELPAGFNINLEIGLIEVWENEDCVFIQASDYKQGGENEDG